MKQLVCEMCGSTDLLKKEGVFVCQSCGCKYSVEEAKKMMVEGTVEVSGTVKVDQSHLIENFLDMASSAIGSGNHSEAEKYCNKVIEIDPHNYRAFLYKGTATAWQSTFAKLRILETINCWKNAFSNCDKENKKEFISYTDSEFRKIVIAMVNLAGSFIENGINDYNRSSYREHLLSILNCVKLYTTSINSAFCGEDVCCEAAISVIPSLMKCAQSEERLYHKIKPSSGESWHNFIEEYFGCIDVIDVTATFGQKDEAKALCYEKAVEVIQTINDLPFYIWSDGRYVPQKNPRNSFISSVEKYKEKAAEARRRIAEKNEEENNKKRAEFWSKHSEEHKTLTRELSKAKQKRDELTKAQKGYSKIKLLDDHISEIVAILKEDRIPTSQLKKSEKDFIKNFENFWDSLSSSDGYDEYLDNYPILKKREEYTQKRSDLIAKKAEIENMKKDLKQSRIGKILLSLSITGIFACIILPAFIDSLKDFVFLFLVGAVVLVGASIHICVYFPSVKKGSAKLLANMENHYKSELVAYNKTIDEMNVVPQYTGLVNSTSVRIPEKIKTDIEIHRAVRKATQEKHIKIPNKIIFISAIVVAVVALILVSYFVIYPNSLKNSSNFNDYITYIEKFDVEHFEIPEGTTIIPEKAFKDCTQLRSITIPSSVTKIGKDAFSGCRNLTSVYISDLKAYCEISFANEYSTPLHREYSYSDPKSTYLYCNGSLVTDLIVPEGTTKIGDYAFCYYDNLRSVTIPDSVKSIGKTAFREIDNLTTVNLGKNVESIGEYAFLHCKKISSISIPANLKTVGHSAFHGCTSLITVNIPQSVLEFGESLFFDCNLLETINYSGTVDQWLTIDKKSKWDMYTGEYTIYCIDGEITKNGTITYK